MLELEQQVKDAGITVMNEIGVSYEHRTLVSRNTLTNR